MGAPTVEAAEQQTERFKSMFVAAMAHPLRVKILARMSEAPTSPSAIARELGLETPTVNYHVGVLKKHKLIKRVDRRPVRGAIENVYRSKVLPVITDEELEKFSDEESTEYVETLLTLWASEASYALEMDTLLGNYWHITRTVNHVDQEGWEDLRDVFMQTYHRIELIKTEAIERLAKDKTLFSMRIMSFQSLFELPPAKSDATAS
jgi:DNA-binding transcriptional ArsR family regulator